MSAYLLTVVTLTGRTPAFVEYARRSAELVSRFGGRYLIRGKAAQVLEGSQFAERLAVVSEFPDRATAMAFYTSPEYQAVKPLRDGTGSYDIGIFDGAP